MKIKIKNSKKFLGAVGIIILIVVIIIAIIVLRNKNINNKNVGKLNSSNEKYVTVADDGTKTNISKKLSKDKTVEGLKVTDISLAEINNTTTLNATIKNTTNKTVEAFTCLIIVLDENGNKIVELSGLISKTEPGQTTKLQVMGTTDFANAYDFEITKK